MPLFYPQSGHCVTVGYSVLQWVTVGNNPRAVHGGCLRVSVSLQLIRKLLVLQKCYRVLEMSSYWVSSRSYITMTAMHLSLCKMWPYQPKTLANHRWRDCLILEYKPTKLWLFLTHPVTLCLRNIKQAIIFQYSSLPFVPVLLCSSFSKSRCSEKPASAK